MLQLLGLARLESLHLAKEAKRIAAHHSLVWVRRKKQRPTKRACLFCWVTWHLPEDAPGFGQHSQMFDWYRGKATRNKEEKADRRSKSCNKADIETFCWDPVVWCRLEKRDQERGHQFISPIGVPSQNQEAKLGRAL